MSISIIGDVLIDKYIYGESERLSPEAPVPIIKYIREEIKLGGAGNVFENLKSLMDDVFLCTSTSNPPIKQRIFCGNHYVSRIDYETNPEWQIDENYKNSEIIIVSDYNKGSIKTPIVLPNKKVIVDPKKSLYEYKGVWCLKPNKKEFESYVGKLPDTINSSNMDLLEKKMTFSRKNLCVNHLIVTLGKDGVAYCNEKDFYHFSSDVHEVFDVTGAGDTFTAVLAYCLHEKKSMLESVKVANKAAGLSCLHIGTFKIKREDLHFEKVIFTNGCFDILHEGHLKLLEKSKKLGSKLIVGLNSDESIKKIKGTNRPINDQFFRKKVLESLKFVDEVIIFDEETPINLIRKIKPDIIVKGGDYRKEEVVGNEICEVVIIPFEVECSTTKIIEKIKNV